MKGNKFLLYESIRLIIETIKKQPNVDNSYLSCKDEKSWQHGNTIFNIAKMVFFLTIYSWMNTFASCLKLYLYLKTLFFKKDFNAYSGSIDFDENGDRKNLTLSILTLNSTEISTIGTWNDKSGLLINYDQMKNSSISKLSHFKSASRTLIITTLIVIYEKKIHFLF